MTRIEIDFDNKTVEVKDEITFDRMREILQWLEGVPIPSNTQKTWKVRPGMTFTTTYPVYTVGAGTYDLDNPFTTTSEKHGNLS